MSASHDLAIDKTPSHKLFKIKKTRKRQTSKKMIKTESILKQVNDSCNKFKLMNSIHIQNRKCSKYVGENSDLDFCRDCILNLNKQQEESGDEEQECRFIGWRK